MIRISLKSVALAAPLALAAAAACSSTPPETYGASGSTGNPTAGSTGTPTAGSTGTPTGGSSTTAGTGSGGASGTTTTTAGSGSGGSSVGGTGSSGNSTGGTAAGGTAAGGGGSGGAGTDCETLACVAGVKNDAQDVLTSSFMMFGCYSKAAQDCITIPAGMQCPNQNTSLPMEEQGITVKQSFKVGGKTGTKYLLTITVNGISEAKYYEKGMRAAGDTDPANPDATNGTDTFYTGGNPVNFENYNVYKITTKDSTGKEIQHYYLNSMPKTNTPYEDHSTYPMAFVHDITVEGGGTIEYLQEDRNCHAVDNCGVGHQSTSCANTAGRKIPNEPNFVFPTAFLGTPLSQLNTAGGATQPWHSQILHIVATAVKPM